MAANAIPGPVVALRVIYEQVDEAMEERVEASAQEAGGGSPCARGCAHCCYQEVPVMASEVIGLVHAVRELGEADRQWVRAALDRALTKLRTIPQEPRPRGAVRYFQARIRCPFLDPNDACRIYESRPLACRTHTVVATDPADCADLRRLVRMVDSEEIAGKAWVAMDDRVGTPKDEQGRPMLILGALPVLLGAAWHLIEQIEPPTIEQVLAVVYPGRASVQNPEQVGP